MTLSGLVLGLTVLAILTSSCGRGSDVGRDEAIEILVLDGLVRSEAECLVAMVEDQLDLAEVTGVSGDLDSQELELLVEASRACQPPTTSGSSGVVTGPLEQLSELDDQDSPASIDVEGLVAEFLRGGLDPDTAVCVATMLLSAPDVAVAVSDDNRKLDAIVACGGG